jgi:type IV secretion system protein VirD4
VSGGAYKMQELCGGNLAVFCQVPLEALQHTPAVARVLVGCHLDAVLRAEGNVTGRVYFPIDEAVLIGKEDSVTVALNQGRKCAITMQLFYLSDAQVARVWGGADARKEIYNNLSWRTYAGVQDLDAARELSATLGTYGARAWSRGTNRGKSGRMLEVQSGSSGSNENEHEISRELAKPHELLTEMRDDERITIVRNRAPIRHGAAIGFRRPEIASLLGDNRYRRNATPVAAE